MPKAEKQEPGNSAAVLRDTLEKFLGGGDAHPDFDKAIAGIPADKRTAVADGIPYSLWQIAEHLRLSQADILEFCVNPDYAERKWPDDYWPKNKQPTEAEWNACVSQFRDDLHALKKMATESSLDLYEKIAHGEGQTYLRELLLVIDHNSYHIGQMIVLRRLLGIWEDRA